MRSILITVFICCATFLTKAQQTVFYTGNNGTPQNDGRSFDKSVDLQTALDRVSAGDTILMKAGVYSVSYSAGSKNTFLLTKSGVQGSPIVIMSEPGKKTTIDFSFPEMEWVQDSYGFEIRGNYWYFKNIDITRAGYQGVYVKGSHNTFENCAFYNNRNTGLEINKGGSYTTVINCDAYRNYDPKKNGSMADGFGPKQTQGPGNKFIGCRAWENSDDGYDCFDSPEKVTFENCWAFRNGINVWNYLGFSGNGNGFKVGGNHVVANNSLVHCVAFGHPNKGFDQNNNAGGLTILNCTGYDNGYNYGLGNNVNSGEKHVLRNNISLDGPNSISNAEESYNSWNSGFSVSSSDFLSLDLSLATIERNTDGTIPETDLFRLKSSSNLINAGVDVGLPFQGSAPELGAFEFEEDLVEDCNGDLGGTASMDDCNVCSGGNTGIEPNSTCQIDCNGDINGSSFIDNCGICVAGNTGWEPCSEYIEAETACSVDGVLLENTNPGFSGDGYVNTENAEGASVSWLLNASISESVTFTFRYANGGGTSRDCNVYLGGVLVSNISMPSTGTWDNWSTISVNLDVNVNSNELKLEATGATGLANIDWLSYSGNISSASCVITGNIAAEEDKSLIYPNPVQNMLYLGEGKDWELYSTLGCLIQSGTGKEVDMTRFNKGYYWLKTGGAMYKVIKQ